jgi:hypothetical protein
MNKIQNIFLKTISIVLLGTVVHLSSMTLEEHPQEIKQLLVQHVIEQSDNAQQARNTLAACAGISRSWGFLRADLRNAKQYAQAQDKTELEANYITRALREKAEQDVEKTRTYQRCHHHYPNLFPLTIQQDLLSSYALEKLTYQYIETNTVSIDSFDILFSKYLIPLYSNRWYNGPIIEGWQCDYASAMNALILTYMFDSNNEKRTRAKTLIATLHAHAVLEPCYIVFLTNSILNNPRVIKHLQSANCSQEEIDFLFTILDHTKINTALTNATAERPTKSLDDEIFHKNFRYTFIYKPIAKTGLISGTIIGCSVLCAMGLYKLTHHSSSIRPIFSALAAGLITGIGFAIVKYVPYRISNYYKVSKVLRSRGFKL